MTFPNPNFDHVGLSIDVKKVIDSHDKPLDGLDAETRKLRTAEESSITIKPHEIPWMQHKIIQRVKTLEREIETLRNSVNTCTAPNLRNAEEELRDLEAEDDYLRHNFGEKFFPKPEDIDNN